MRAAVLWMLPWALKQALLHLVLIRFYQRISPASMPPRSITFPACYLQVSCQRVNATMWIFLHLHSVGSNYESNVQSDPWLRSVWYFCLSCGRPWFNSWLRRNGFERGLIHNHLHSILKGFKGQMTKDDALMGHEAMGKIMIECAQAFYLSNMQFQQQLNRTKQTYDEDVNN